MAHPDGVVLYLRVAEGLARDAGRGLARLDPDAMQELGVQVGDTIEIRGKRRTVAKVLPTHPQHRGLGLIQMDGVLRFNAGASLDEKVEVRRTGVAAASVVLLVPVSPVRLEPGEARYLQRLIEGLPVTNGDRIRVSLFTSRAWEFVVSETVPAGAVLIHPGTSIRLKRAENESRGVRVSYEDIGGLEKEVQKIREMIELPLKFPGLFQRLGIEPPKGVLLHGPPGCGKTLIARAVASETDAYFTAVSGPEIIHKFYGESEAHLRQIFDEARRNAPAIVFIDEIDAIAPKRTDVVGEVEKRVVAQLLALMDGLRERGQVVVIGATNLPNSIDPALRRPGRFDREIAIPVPNRRARWEILQVHTRGMPLSHDVDMERLSAITHGFVGADLEALCREAAMGALRRVMATVDVGKAHVPDEVLDSLEVTMADFTEALRTIEPSAIREVFVEVPEVHWEDVGGQEEAVESLKESVLWPLQYGELFAYAGLRPPKGILLFGPPGTGKTLLAKALATESGLNFISVKGPELLSKFVGESERAVREVFHKARQAAPCILFFDEIDSLVPVRGGLGDSHVVERVLSQFLAELDGIEELSGVVILAATNRKDMIDPALLRAGRFDLQIELRLPDEAARRAILRIHTRGKPLSADVDLDALSGQTDGFSGADLEALVRGATAVAIRRFINAYGGGGNREAFCISRTHFEEALRAAGRGR